MNYVDAEFDSTIIDEREMMAFFEVKAFCFPTYLAKETIDLLELIYTNKAATETSCIAMIEHLKKCEDKDMIPRELTGKLKSIAHKIGAVSEARTDAGILYFDGGPVVICVLTAENKDKRWTSENSAEILIGKIGLSVFEHFKTKK